MIVVMAPISQAGQNAENDAFKKRAIRVELGSKIITCVEKGESFLFLRRCLRDSVVLLFSVFFRSLFRLWNLGVIKTPKMDVQSTDRIMLSHRSPSVYTVYSLFSIHLYAHFWIYSFFFSNVFYGLIYHFWSVVGAQLVVGIDHFDYYSPVPAGDKFNPFLSRWSSHHANPPHAGWEHTAGSQTDSKYLN